MTEEKKDFIDFIKEAKKSERLTRGVREATSARELKEFFVREGYKGITLKQCEKLVYYLKHLPRDIEEMIDLKKMY